MQAIRWVSAIFCDDVRPELGGKISLMGIYDTDLLALSFPLHLPKLCVQVKLRIGRAEMPKSIRFLALLGEQTIGEWILDEEILSSKPMPPADPDISNDDLHLTLAAGFIFTPLVAAEPTRLKIRAYVDDEELKANSLNIRLPTEEEKKNIPGMI
jgi:hypothetical protein